VHAENSRSSRARWDSSSKRRKKTPRGPGCRPAVGGLHQQPAERYLAPTADAPTRVTAPLFDHWTLIDPAAYYANRRLLSASNDGYTHWFAYDVMGRVAKQTLVTPRTGSKPPWAYWNTMAPPSCIAAIRPR
jgi:hypothetical protein